MTSRVAVLHLGRARGMGEERRLDSWRAIAGAAGADVVDVPLLSLGRPRLRDLPVRSGRTVQGRAVPESLAWNRGRAFDALDRAAPAAIVCVTSRTYDVGLHDLAPVVILDFVDQLSTNYAHRGDLRGRMERLGWRALARSHHRFEARAARTPRSILTAAGRADALALGAEWVPNVVQPVAVIDSGRPEFDLLFFGNLAYPPNIAAVRRLARIWPLLIARRPGTTLLLAGARPKPEVQLLSAQNGWTLRADFKDVRDVCSAANIGVVPLEQAGGIQNKVLEAASYGLAQILTPAVMAGLDHAFPAVVATDDDGLVRAVAHLLDDEAKRTELAAAARRHVREKYAALQYASWLGSLLIDDGDGT